MAVVKDQVSIEQRIGEAMQPPRDAMGATPAARRQKTRAATAVHATAEATAHGALATTTAAPRAAPAAS